MHRLQPLSRTTCISTCSTDLQLVSPMCIFDTCSCLPLLCVKSKNLTLAKQQYRRAIQKQPRTCPQSVYLRLADCFMASADATFACDMYELACELQPCTSAWLGAGVAHLRLGDYEAADLALSQANIMDSQHPEVWGYLTLLSLLQGREADANLVGLLVQVHRDEPASIGCHKQQRGCHGVLGS